MLLPRRAMTPAATAFAEFLKQYLVSHQEGGRGRRRS